MKVQYFGDVSDYRKLAILRLLAEVGRFKIGVCWMMTEDDATGHGGNRAYRKQPDAWRHFDPLVFDVLRSVPPEPQLADLRRVEEEGLIPGATFFIETAPDARDARARFHGNCLAALADSELVFFDPDNGLEVASFPKGRKRSNKYVFLDEIAEHYAEGRSALLYQHFPMHRTRPSVVADAVQRLGSVLPGASLWSLETPHVVFLLAAGRSTQSERKK